MRQVKGLLVFPKDFEVVDDEASINRLGVQIPLQLYNFLDIEALANLL